MSEDQMLGKPVDGVTQNSGGLKRRDLLLSGSSLLAASVLSSTGLTTSAQAHQQPAAPAGQRPDIVVIMGDDIGMWNIGAYHRGLMAGRTPNLDKIASEAVRAEQRHGHGGRLPRALHDPLAGQGAGGQSRERNHLRAGLVRPFLRRPATRTSLTN
jgi:hypothetical protein